MSDVRAAVVVLIVLAQTIPGAGDGGHCAPAEHPGGAWASYGHDLSNTRTQPAETLIGADTVRSLTTKWDFNAQLYGAGLMNNTPIVADGCIYLGGSSGLVVALNADTGEFIWRFIFETEPSGLGGSLTGSPTVVDGVLYVLVNGSEGPYAAALDAETGDDLWMSESLDAFEDVSGWNAYSNASPVVFDGLVLAGFSVPENVGDAHGGFAILDAATGAILEKTYTIPVEDWDEGFAGGGVWGTAIIDPATRYAYVGTSNPFSKRREHPRTNAIIQIDVDRTRATFGEIVDSYKADLDTPLGTYDQPACQEYGEEPGPIAGGSLACLQLDIDFGASPNLFTDTAGRTVVGNLQKSGNYHAVYADTLEPAWRTRISWPSEPPSGNAGSSAVHDGAVFATVNPGVAWSLDAETGSYRWVGATGDVVRYQSTSVANGLVYTVDTNGFLNAWDDETGVQLLKLPMMRSDLQRASGGGAAGVAIARNTVYAAANETLLAYAIP